MRLEMLLGPLGPKINNIYMVEPGCKKKWSKYLYEILDVAITEKVFKMIWLHVIPNQRCFNGKSVRGPE